ncbi:uncharacterized protein TM35_000033210 [Trypanosoma theileri]|uniref:Uncharacterized protein n=1 Tax=Trypanosoma theileri TaxID=67003 RepID=A0A1X0P6S9_9TRYP|nr:uncharacterized protein TM35_000033210 [Trypanosoma theileri]ORC92568.1 hypothetical protein TM35_000033210 [Trypanosoma theileri]
MWCISRRLMCGAATTTTTAAAGGGGVASSSTSSSAVTGSSSFSFSKRLKELESDPECPLSGPEYKLLLEKLQHYRSLQNVYAVKQDDIERARRAAHYSGLEFTAKKPRIPTKNESNLNE